MKRRTFLGAIVAAVVAGPSAVGALLARERDPIVFATIRGPLVVNEIGFHRCPSCHRDFAMDDPAYDPELYECSDCFEKFRFVRRRTLHDMVGIVRGERLMAVVPLDSLGTEYRRVLGVG